MSQILETLRETGGPDLLVGFDTADDAGVYRLDATRAVVSTADFITPVVDDARVFGRVAAANSLSDIYAMGARPFMAINLLGYPPAELPNETLTEILAGGADICRQAGCAVAGGHTVRDEEVKFGLSVTGEVHPDHVLRNSTARPGDRLVLTKPLGTGALVAAAKAGKLEPVAFDALVTCMTTLNDVGTRLWAAGASAVTDVTGFGLSGHALEMALGADVKLTIDTASLPQLPDAQALCGAGFTCGGTNANATFTQARCVLAPSLAPDMIGLVHDPQTSGGLLIAVPAERCDELTAIVNEAGALCAATVGEVSARGENDPYLEFS